MKENQRRGKGAIPAVDHPTALRRIGSGSLDRMHTAMRSRCVRMADSCRGGRRGWHGV